MPACSRTGNLRMDCNHLSVCHRSVACSISCVYNLFFKGHMPGCSRTGNLRMHIIIPLCVPYGHACLPQAGLLVADKLDFKLTLKYT